MTDLFAALLQLLGAGFMLIAALGLYRMPDLLTRMHATTKAGVLGAGLMLLGLLFLHPEVHTAVRVIAIVGFTVLTAPIAAHVIGRAGYFSGVALWEGTIKDELKGRYDSENHTLASSDDSTPESVATSKPEQEIVNP